MGRRSILLIVAVVIAALGATMVFLYVQSVDAKAEKASESVDVLAATAQIEAGESIEDAQEAGKLDSVAVPRKNVVPGALTDTGGLEGMIALATIYVGEQIIPGQFGKTGTSQTITIPDGTMAISVQVDDPSRVAGFVTPGSSVAVFVSAEPEVILPDGGTRRLPDFTRLLLAKVEVIGVGDTTLLSTTKTDPEGTATTEAIPKTILTLALTQAQAEKAIFSSKNGTLTFALLNDKSVVKPSSGAVLQNLFK